MSVTVTPSRQHELASWLLADAAVQSVTIDDASGEAWVRGRGYEIDRRSLSELATLFTQDAKALAGTGVMDVECWQDDVTGRQSYVRSADEATGWRRAMHLSLAAVWFTLAVLGAILPGLPCTGFLLLTSYSLCRSSKRLHNKLLTSRWFGPTLRHWRVHRGVRPGVKTKALTMLTLMVGSSLAFAPLPTIAWWAVAIAGAIGASCILRLRVVTA